MRFALILAALAFFFSSSLTRADNVTVTTSSPGWVQVAPNTWVLPADLSGIGCGMENETSCEPMGVFNFNVRFPGIVVGTAVPAAVLDPTGAVSDIIAVGVDNKGLGFVSLLSDPGVPQLSELPVLCTETDDSGCVTSFTITPSITVTAAFDGEKAFDPFGAGFDISDGIKFTTAVPEPGSFALLAGGLLGLAGMLRKKKLLSR